MKTIAELTPGDGYFYNHFYKSKKSYNDLSEEERPKTFEAGLESIALDYYFNTPDLFRSKPGDWTGFELYTYYFLDIIQKGADWLTDEQNNKITDLMYKINAFYAENDRDLGYADVYSYNFLIRQEVHADIRNRRFKKLRYADNLIDTFMHQTYSFFEDPKKTNY